MASNDSNCRYVAKRISRGREVQILEILRAIPRSIPRNHIIHIIDVLTFKGDEVLVIMPRYTVLSDVVRLTPERYFQLQYQLLEVRCNWNVHSCLEISFHHYMLSHFFTIWTSLIVTSNPLT